MLVYGRRLIVIPFRAELPVSDPFESLDDFRPLPASYTLNLTELGIRNVKDYVFLEVIYFYFRRSKNSCFFVVNI